MLPGSKRKHICSQLFFSHLENSLIFQVIFLEIIGDDPERHNRKATNMLDMYAWNMSKYNTMSLKQHQTFCFPTQISSSEQ